MDGFCEEQGLRWGVGVLDLGIINLTPPAHYVNIKLLHIATPVQKSTEHSIGNIHIFIRNVS